jgi:hypothetical protein
MRLLFTKNRVSTAAADAPRIVNVAAGELPGLYVAVVLYRSI